jgi:hypothetical protein
MGIVHLCHMATSLYGDACNYWTVLLVPRYHSPDYGHLTRILHTANSCCNVHITICLAVPTQRDLSLS